MKKTLRRILAIVVLTCAYGMTWILSVVLRSPGTDGPARRNGRILVIGTFHNPNWFFAHLEPLARCSDSEVILVADGHTADIEGLTVVVPPAWISRILTRGAAKILWSFWYALRKRPDMYMGYAIFPAATTALLLGRIFRRPACFQVTSGPLELDGGGYHAENRVLSMLGYPSAWVEKLVLGVTRQFELLVVRGGRAEAYLRDNGATNRIVRITGSVAMPDSVPPPAARPIDVIFVGRLTPRKRPDRFVAAMAQVAKQLPQVRACIVGDGPEDAALQKQINELGLEENIELLGLRSDVLDLQLQSRIFALTSRWEGVSIAMLEAMSCGTIPVVSNVGDLADVVQTGFNGVILDENDIDGFAGNIAAILQDDQRLAELSAAARQTVVDQNSREAVTRRWTKTLAEINVVDGETARS